MAIDPSEFVNGVPPPSNNRTQKLKKGNRVLINRWLSQVLRLPGWTVSRLFAPRYDPDAVHRYLLDHGYQSEGKKPD